MTEHLEIVAFTLKPGAREAAAAELCRVCDLGELHRAAGRPGRDPAAVARALRVAGPMLVPVGDATRSEHRVAAAAGRGRPAGPAATAGP